MSKPKKSEIAFDLDKLTERVTALEETVFGGYEEEADLDHCEQCNDCHYYDLDEDSKDDADDHEEPTRVVPEAWSEFIDRMLLNADLAHRGFMAAPADTAKLHPEVEVDPVKTVPAFETTMVIDGVEIDHTAIKEFFGDDAFDIFEDDEDEDVDPVNHPSHYADDPSGVECIEFTQHMNFNLGNAFKYLFRAGRKGGMLEDLRKALWYVNHQREMLEEGWEIPPSFPMMGNNPTVVTYMNYRYDASEIIWEREDSVLVAMQYDEITHAMMNIIHLSSNTFGPKGTLGRVSDSIEWAIFAQEELEAK